MTTPFGIQQSSPPSPPPPPCGSTKAHVHLRRLPSGMWRSELRERGGTTHFGDRDLQVVLVTAAIKLGLEVEELSPEFSESLSAVRDLFADPDPKRWRELSVVATTFAMTLRDTGLTKAEVEMLLPGVMEQIGLWEIEAGGWPAWCA